MEKESSNEKSETINSGEQNIKMWVALMTIITALICFVGTIFYTQMAASYRATEVDYVQENYTFLNPPQKVFTGALEDRHREVVFLNRFNEPVRGEGHRHLETKNLAILYAAEVEAKVGKQEWLKDAYQSYVLTENELKRLHMLDKEFEEKKRALSSNFTIRLEAKQEQGLNTAASAQEVLKDRALLATR